MVWILKAIKREGGKECDEALEVLMGLRPRFSKKSQTGICTVVSMLKHGVDDLSLLYLEVVTAGFSEMAAAEAAGEAAPVPDWERHPLSGEERREAEEMVPQMEALFRQDTSEYLVHQVPP